MYHPCFLLYKWQHCYFNRHFIFHQNIAILLEEVNTNTIKLHISENSREKHDSTVNICIIVCPKMVNGGSRHKLILTLFFNCKTKLLTTILLNNFKVSVFLSKRNLTMFH